MATYKVIQDIEAEDHILGPLSLRQFLFGLVAAFFLYLSVVFVMKGVAFMVIISAPFVVFCGFFAFPWGKDQPTEVWALAKFRFYFKPRKRIWNQSGIKELVTITVPKKIEIQYTDGLSQTEVKSRLQALATTIDSRGWALKGGTYTPTTTVGAFGQPAPNSDRLLAVAAPQPVADNIPDEADILNEAATSPLARQFDSMINTAAQQKREELIQRMNSAAQAQAPVQQPQWFTQNPIQTAQQPIDDQALAAQLRSNAAAGRAQATANLKTIPVTPAAPAQTPAPATEPVQAAPQTTPQPQSIVPAPTPAQPTPAVDPAPVTAAPNPAILELARSNDLNIATLAREAKKSDNDEEVVISLR